MVDVVHQLVVRVWGVYMCDVYGVCVYDVCVLCVMCVWCVRCVCVCVCRRTAAFGVSLRQGNPIHS